MKQTFGNNGGLKLQRNCFNRLSLLCLLISLCVIGCQNDADSKINISDYPGSLLVLSNPPSGSRGYLSCSRHGEMCAIRILNGQSSHGPYSSLLYLKGLGTDFIKFPFEGYTPTLSPSAKYLAYEDKISGLITIVSLKTEMRHELNTTLRVISMHWSDENSLIIGGYDEDDLPVVYRYNMEDHVLELVGVVQIRDAPNNWLVKDIALSPDARYIALVLEFKDKDEQEGDIYLLDLDKNELIALTNTPHVAETALHWRSQKTIVFISDERSKQPYHKYISYLDVETGCMLDLKEYNMVQEIDLVIHQNKLAVMTPEGNVYLIPLPPLVCQ